MDYQNGSQGGMDNGHTHQEIWGAKDSLRRTLSKRGSDEGTPLLGNGSGSGSNNNGGSREHAWEGQADFEGLGWWHTPSMYWLLPPFFCFALAVGGIAVPRLNLILSLVCREYFIEKSSSNPNFVFAPVILGATNPQCRIPEIQALATKFTLYITIISGILSAIMSPKMGAWSDRHGRLKLLAITSCGGLLSEIITILAAKYPDTISYHWMLAGATLDGICGSFTAGMALTHAYATDCTPPPQRAVAFGYFHACLFGGIAIGPLIAAALVKLTDSIITPFWFALAIHIFFITFIMFVPESLTKTRQKVAQDKYAQELTGLRAINDHVSGAIVIAFDVFVRRVNIFKPLKVLFPTGPGSNSAIRLNLILLAAVDTIIFGVAMGAITVVVYYSGYQFGWDTAQISVFTSVVNSFRVTALIVVLPLLNYVVRTRRANRQRRESGFALPEPNSGSDSMDIYLIRTAIAFEVVGYCGYAAARTAPMFVIAGIMAALGGIGSPTLQSALTKHVPHDKVGQLLGATGLLHALARIVCPLIFNLIYAGTVSTFPQAVFVVLTGCFGVAFLCSWFIRPHVYLEDPVTGPGQTSTSADPDVLLDEEIAGI